jgi:hypothetical protein
MIEAHKCLPQSKQEEQNDDAVEEKQALLLHA